MSILKKKQSDPAPLIVINLDRLKKTNSTGKKVSKKSTVKKTAASKSGKKQKKPGKIKQTINEVSIAMKVIKKLLWCIKLIFKMIVKVFQTLLGRK